MLVISHKEGRCAFETFRLQIDKGISLPVLLSFSINSVSELSHL